MLRFHGYVLMGIAALLPAASTHAGEVSSVPAELQGSWKVVGLEVDGKSNDPAISYVWVIKGDKVVYGGETLAALKVDATTTPKSIDLAFVKPERTYEAVYELRDGALRMCVNRVTEGVKERPTDFTTKEKPDRRLLTFERLKDTDDVTPGGYVGMMLRAAADRKEIIISDALEGSPAKKAGVQKDDVLLRIGTASATELQEVVRLCRQAKPQSELTLRVKRGDKELDITVKVGIVPFFLLDA
jgi:uncharacterized protein (TIGR03067 family)